ncbi:MAG TPA: energy transducer TonB [Gammaproteobacteria bacterium]|nr:energy transducer TonB [Gammaproteobacteria bacterium]
MNATHPQGKDAGRQSDLLLWVAGAVVTTVGVAWLLISQPWSSGPERTVAFARGPASGASESQPAPATAGEPGSPDTQTGVETTLDNPLKLAQLAYDAGMLVEPEEYSAWTLYAKVFEDEPDNVAAREGLTKVADDLLRRGETALEQGRLNDARATVERVLAALPAHEGAKALASRIRPDVGVAGAAAAAEPFKPLLPVQQPMPAVALVPVVVQEEAPRARPVVDPVVEAHAAFEQAMSLSRLLTPADQSAKHFVAVLVDAQPSHELTRDARARLSSEFLSRASQSLEALDADAARTWIDEAELIGVDSDGVNAARDAWTTQLIAMEAAKPLPASALKIADYVAPVYPQRALERRLEGWVDLQFTVATDGTTRDVTVTDASHENYFRREAVTAVEHWRFEPRMFLGRAIEQRSYTRIRFVE